jgi:hypothetical protein
MASSKMVVRVDNKKVLTKTPDFLQMRVYPSAKPLRAKYCVNIPSSAVQREQQFWLKAFGSSREIKAVTEPLAIYTLDKKSALGNFLSGVFCTSR